MAHRTVVVGLGRRGREWVAELTAAPAFYLVGAVDLDPAVDVVAVVVVMATSPDAHVEPCRVALEQLPDQLGGTDRRSRRVDLEELAGVG